MFTLMTGVVRPLLLANSCGGDGAGTAADGHHPGLHHLPDSEGLEVLQQRAELLSRAGGLDGECLRSDVDGLGAEQVHDLEHLAADARVGAHLHQQELALHRCRRLELDDLDDVDQLVELLGDLLEREVVDGDDDRHPRDLGVLGGPDRERLDVEPAAREQAGHPGEHARLVLDQHRQGVPLDHDSLVICVLAAASSATISSESNSGRMSRAAMIWSLPVPAATIGHTWASAPTTKSMTTVRSLISMAWWITLSTSSLDSARSPTHPMASASSLKSGIRCLCVPRSVLEYRS